MDKVSDKLQIFVLVVCFAWSGSNTCAAEPSPTDQIRHVVDQVLALLQNGELARETRRQGIREAVAPHFDYRAMSQSTLALSWKRATPAQQNRFVELFPKILENVYIVAMEEYSGETVKYGKEQIKGKRASVETLIVQPDGPEIPVVYRMRLKDGQWLAYDVVIEGVSLVSNYRSSFQRIAQIEGMDALLEQLEEKVASQLQEGT